MKNDEFAFFNQQLAAMLRDGIPLEGALKQLCNDMQRGRLRDELQALEADLARGTPMADALKPRRLPEIYKRMVLVGVKSGDLPGALTMLADYFQRQNDLWTRLKSMMTYPLIVMFVGFVISFVIAALWNFVIGPSFKDVFAGMNMMLPAATIFALESLHVIWTFPLVLGVLFFLAITVVFQPGMRGKFLWRLPAFKEANIARIASALTLLMKNGVNLPDAIGVVEKLEDNKMATADMQDWKTKLSAGVAKFSEVASKNRMFPPLFVWVVSGAGEDLTGGFRRAAEIYHSRAIYRTEVALFSVLPIASLFLGAIVISQAFLVISMFLPMFLMISNLAG
ncbi:MAG TPA: type II secretion system F family protein [Candidatus Acidoferrales bacterium]|jgi:type II secretory pathway component PulF|nr:type II secretion system F family protein [Candidatus Acidoferrales bacterium]